MERVGFGTERVEAEIRKLFPHARIARVDRDTVRRKGSLVEILEKVASRDVDILIGTQMIAKGHDFPEVTLVGVISADVGLGLADFRASERTFQLLTQVAGRAGRGERPGEAIIQSLLPNHYAITLACTQNYRDFYDNEIKYPPRDALSAAGGDGQRRRARPDRSTRRWTARAISPMPRAAAKGFVILGPAPAPLTKLRGEHRAQFFLKGTSRKAMREALQLARRRASRRSRSGSRSTSIRCRCSSEPDCYGVERLDRRRREADDQDQQRDAGDDQPARPSGTSSSSVGG